MQNFSVLIYIGQAQNLCWLGTQSKLWLNLVGVWMHINYTLKESKFIGEQRLIHYSMNTNNSILFTTSATNWEPSTNCPSLMSRWSRHIVTWVTISRERLRKEIFNFYHWIPLYRKTLEINIFNLTGKLLKLKSFLMNMQGILGADVISQTSPHWKIGMTIIPESAIKDKPQ